MNLVNHTCRSMHRLPESVLNHLQSQITINSFEAAVRELLQNSLDAGANEIIIKLDLRSLSFCVEDNGPGMNPEELEKVGKRYFTSKIDLLEDLRAIKTFGFRGEALHSIGCISHLSIISKHTSSSHVFKLNKTGGEQQAYIYKFEEESCNYLESHFKFNPILQSGTIVTATSLFANIPVRQNQILKLPEHKVIEDVRKVILQSLIGMPDVKLRLMKLDHKSDKFHKVLSVESNHDSEVPVRYATIYKSIYGHSFLPEYETLKANFQSYKLNGIISLYPSQSKSFQYIFINKRPLLISNEDSKLLNKIFVDSNFGGIFTPGTSTAKLSPSKQYTSKSFSRFPIFIVNIQCPNIIEDLFQDPSKTIYYSNHTKLILSMVRNVFSSFLKAQGYEYITRGFSVSPNISPSSSPKRQKKSVSPSKKNTSFIPTLSSDLGEKNLKSGTNYVDLAATPRLRLNQNASTTIKSFSTNESSLQNLYFFENQPKHDELKEHEVGEFDLKETIIDKNDLIHGNYRIVKQVDRKFILLMMPTFDSVSLAKLPTLLAVDQHACDERIRVESLLKEFILMSLNKLLGTKLNEPFIFAVSARENTLFKSYRSNFESLGINYIISAEYEITITHLPHLLIEKISTDIDFLKFCLLQHLFDLEYHKKKVDIANIPPEKWFQNVVQLPLVIIDCINSKACRSAIMFGDQLTYEEMVYLIKSLSACNQPFKCAHGRPSIVPLASIN